MLYSKSEASHEYLSRCDKCGYTFNTSKPKNVICPKCKDKITKKATKNYYD